MLIDQNPFRRPMRGNDHRFIDFSKSLGREELRSNASLAANRLLLNIYETDLLFLPLRNTEAQWREFEAFYSTEAKVAGERIRPSLECFLFGFLYDEIEVSGPWSGTALRDYFVDFEQRTSETEDETLKMILTLPNRKDCARFYLMQLASDFLSEASAMARNILGNGGHFTSGLFKILIDEYGYGVHTSKHSTLFEKTLVSAELKAELHSYWQYYLPTSLMLTNYFHWVSRDHLKFFRYLGALYYTEVSLVSITRSQSHLLRTIFGEEIDTRYFDEHTHIDHHHGDMAYGGLIAPAVDLYGDWVIPEILRGFEEWT